MIKLIIGGKGSGKTKTMIDMINTATKTTTGCIVCIEKSMKLTYEVDHSVRLIHVDEYDIYGADKLLGFFAGVLAGNYDITEVYFDGILKMLGKDLAALETLIAGFEKLAGDAIKVVITVSVDESELTEGIKKYLS